MEGYDYASNDADSESPQRITKAPVIKQDSEDVGLTQRAIFDLFKEIKKAKEQEGKHISIFCSFL